MGGGVCVYLLLARGRSFRPGSASVEFFQHVFGR